MSAHFHAEFGPFTVDVQLDDSGIHMPRGPLSQAIAWEKISGATLLRTAHRDESEDKRDEQRAAQFLEPDAALKIHELRDKPIETKVIASAKWRFPHRSTMPAFCGNLKLGYVTAGSLNQATGSKRQNVFTPIRAFSRQFSSFWRCFEPPRFSRRLLYLAFSDPF